MDRGDAETNGTKLSRIFSSSTLAFATWLLITSLSIAALIHTVVFTNLPDFSEPHKGFETRGTILSGRASALDNLADASRPSSFLTGNPEGRRGRMQQEDLRSWLKVSSADKGRVHTHTVVVSPENATRLFPAPEVEPSSIDIIEEDEEDEDFHQGLFGRAHNHSHLGGDHFCAQPTWGHARIVVSNMKEGLDLWNLDAVHEICQLQAAMEPLYTDVCETYEDDNCCPAWSLPAFAALSANISSCRSISQENLDSLMELLVFCAPSFHGLALECTGENCQFAPHRCTHLSIVRSLMDFVLDTRFLPPNASRDQSVLRYTQIVLPIARSTRSYHFYLKLDDVLSKTSFKHIKVVAMDLGLKDFLFDKILIQDSARLGLASLCIVSVLLLAFVRSPGIVALGLINILLSLAVSYWIYCQVFGPDRFPFLNLLAGLLLLAIGTDDVLFIAQGWGERCDKKVMERLRGLSTLWLSVAATSLTTAFAMFAARLSSVTSVALFSIFAGSLMLINLLMTLLWMLPSIVLMERVVTCCQLSCAGLSVPLASFLHRMDSYLKAGLLWAVTRLPGICIVITLVAACSASYITFVSPRLQAPDSKSFALFHESHPFERYESDFAESFWFERRQRPANILPLTWVWGIVPHDSRDPLDPQARPNASALQFDNNFDISKPKSQSFLLRFCRQLKQQPFYKSTLGPLLPNCFLESLINYMSRRCYDSFDNIDRKPCCESSKFPYTTSVFSICLQRAMKDLHNTPAQFFMPGLAGPKYDTRTNVSERSPPKAIVIQFDSSHEFSLSYQTMNKFYTQVETWTEKMLRVAPKSMKGGFFISDLQFYDLQHHLMSESLTSVIVAACVCTLILYAATRNVVVTSLASACVCATVVSALALLTLLGWRLNVLESLAVTMASGLSVDFVLHYAIKFSAHLEGDIRIKYLIYKNASPITVATLTTLSTGLLLLTSNVLAFNQIGSFIIILSVCSFLFSNFGFLSLLYKFGPSFETDCEFCKRWWTFNEIQDEANVTSQAPLSDSNSVTLTGLPPLSPELHEMENMSPTFLEDPSAPHTSVFDTPVAALNNTEIPKPAIKIQQKHPEISILEPLLQKN